MLNRSDTGLSGGSKLGVMDPERQNQTILVAEDEPDVGAVVARILEKAGYPVLLADGAEAAISLWEQHESRVALLLTDVQMPGMSGSELADHILEREPRIPVLFMSGGDWNACRGFGCVSKPFTRTELVGKVAAALGGRNRGCSAA